VRHGQRARIGEMFTDSTVQRSKVLLAGLAGLAQEMARYGQFREPGVHVVAASGG
jgi:hypothetical protein